MLLIAPPEVVAVLFGEARSRDVQVARRLVRDAAAEVGGVARHGEIRQAERARIVDGAAVDRREPAGDRQAGDRGGHTGGDRENAGGVVAADREIAGARALDRLWRPGVPVLASASVPPVKVIVPVVLKITVFGAGLTMFAGLALVLISAQPTPVRSVPTARVSAFVETT